MLDPASLCLVKIWQSQKPHVIMNRRGLNLISNIHSMQILLEAQFSLIKSNPLKTPKQQPRKLVEQRYSKMYPLWAFLMKLSLSIAVWVQKYLCCFVLLLVLGQAGFEDWFLGACLSPGFEQSSKAKGDKWKHLDKSHETHLPHFTMTGFGWKQDATYRFTQAYSSTKLFRHSIKKNLGWYYISQQNKQWIC